MLPAFFLMSSDENIGSTLLYIASVSSLSADFGPVGAIECLNLTGVFLTYSTSISSFAGSTKLLFASVGFLRPLAKVLALTTPAILGADGLLLEVPTLAVCDTDGLCVNAVVGLFNPVDVLLT